MFGAEHAVTENVAAHIADANNIEWFFLGVVAKFTEVDFD